MVVYTSEYIKDKAQKILPILYCNLSKAYKKSGNTDRIELNIALIAYVVRFADYWDTATLKKSDCFLNRK